MLSYALVAAVVTDLKYRRIFNAITYPAILLGLALAFAAGGVGGEWTTAPGLLSALAGAVAASALFFALSLTGGIGMGDVKLMAAVGALLGFPAALGALLSVSLAGGVQGIVAVAARTAVGRRLCAAVGMTGADEPDFARSVPYGLAIAVGTVVFRLWQRAAPAG